jgi:hypothetical protein
VAKSSVASIPVLGSARKCSNQVWDINLLPWPNVQSRAGTLRLQMVELFKSS